MKIAFISDIHGNAVALESVLEDIQSKEVDKIVVLGDISFRGPEPKRSLDIVRSLNTDVIKGNADEWIVRGINEGEVPDKALDIMRIERDWATSKLEDDDIKYLSQLPRQLSIDLTKDVKINCFHATPTSLFEVVHPTVGNEELAKKMMVKKTADLFIYGHIHVPFVRFINGKCICNLGSVGLPFDGQPRSSYIIVEGEAEQYNVMIQRVKYDVEKVINQYKDLDYPNLDFMSQLVRTGKL